MSFEKLKKCLVYYGILKKPKAGPWEPVEGFGYSKRVYRGRQIGAVYQLPMVYEGVTKLVYLAECGRFKMTCATEREAKSVVDIELQSQGYDI